MRAGRAAACLCYTYSISITVGICHRTQRPTALCLCSWVDNISHWASGSFWKYKLDAGKSHIGQRCQGSVVVRLYSNMSGDAKSQWESVSSSSKLNRHTPLSAHIQLYASSVCWMMPPPHPTPFAPLSLWSVDLAVNSWALLCSFPFRLVGLTSRCSSG